MDSMSTIGIESLRDKKLRVVAYARYAKNNPDWMPDNAEVRLGYIIEEIALNLNWTFAGGYLDKGMVDPYSYPDTRIQDLLKDCREGKIDVVYVKSIERLARNTGSLLSIVDELSRLEPPVGVFFETENLFTLDENNNLCEFMKVLQKIMEKAEKETQMKAETPRCLCGLTNISESCGVISERAAGHDRI